MAYFQSLTRRTRATLALISIALIWGLTFPLIKDSVQSIPAFTFLMLRFLIGAVFLEVSRRTLPSFALFQASVKPYTSTELRVGLFLGCVLFIGFAFQTVGMEYTTASNAGFITGLSVIIVPLLALLAGVKIAPLSWVGIGVSIWGICLLSLTPELSVNFGDLLILGCAFAFAFHILLVGKYSALFDPVKITLIQLWVGVVFSLACALIRELPWLEQLKYNLSSLSLFSVLSIIFCGIFASAVAFLVHLAVQKDSTPVRTALIFTCEPVFGALFSFLIVGEVLSTRQMWGGFLMVLAMLIAEVGPLLPGLFKSKTAR